MELCLPSIENCAKDMADTQYILLNKWIHNKVRIFFLHSSAFHTCTSPALLDSLTSWSLLGTVFAQLKFVPLSKFTNHETPLKQTVEMEILKFFQVKDLPYSTT